MPHSTKPQHVKQTTSKEEDEATLGKRAKKAASKVEEHTLPRPSMTKEVYWRCCCRADNYGGEFPERCAKCDHFWCQSCPY